MRFALFGLTMVGLLLTQDVKAETEIPAQDLVVANGYNALTEEELLLCCLTSDKNQEFIALESDQSSDTILTYLFWPRLRVICNVPRTAYC